MIAHFKRERYSRTICWGILIYVTKIVDQKELESIAHRLASKCRGGEVFELVGDVGAGKTTFVKAFAKGLAIDEDIQSPSFTISREYKTPSGLRLVHYDFYRLDEAGITGLDFAEDVTAADTITMVEWADTVKGVLPENVSRIRLQYVADENMRAVEIIIPDAIGYLEEAA